MEGDAGLTKRQLQALPYLLACGTYEEAARQANIRVKQICQICAMILFYSRPFIKC